MSLQLRAKNRSLIGVDLLEGANRNVRRPKRRRPVDSGPNDECEQKRTASSPSNRNSFIVPAGPSRRLSASSTPSVCFSSSEDEPAASLQPHQLNGNLESNTAESHLPPPTTSQPSETSTQQRKRHQRKPVRQKPVQLSNDASQSSPFTTSVKDEPCDTDDNSVTHGNSNDDHPSANGRKPSLLSTTGGHTAHDFPPETKTGANTSSTYKWLHQAFRSLLPSHPAMTNIELALQQSSSPGQSGKNRNRTLKHQLCLSLSFDVRHGWFSFHSILVISICDTTTHQFCT